MIPLHRNGFRLSLLFLTDEDTFDRVKRRWLRLLEFQKQIQRLHTQPSLLKKKAEFCFEKRDTLLQAALLYEEAGLEFQMEDEKLHPSKPAQNLVKFMQNRKESLYKVPEIPKDYRRHSIIGKPKGRPAAIVSLR